MLGLCSFQTLSWRHSASDLSGPLNNFYGEKRATRSAALPGSRVKASCVQVASLERRRSIARLSLSVALARTLRFLQEPSEQSDTWKSDQVLALNME